MDSLEEQNNVMYTQWSIVPHDDNAIKTTKSRELDLAIVS